MKNSNPSSEGIDLDAIRWLINHYLPTPAEGLGDHNYVPILGAYGTLSMRVGDWRRAQTALAALIRLRGAQQEEKT